MSRSALGTLVVSALEEVEAHYPGELDKLGITPDQAALNFLSFGRRAFTMAGAPEGNLLRGDLPELRVTQVARREGEAAYEWFVDPRRVAEGGVVLYEITRAPPEGLFQGGLTEPARQAAALGFVGRRIRTLETGCEGWFEYHFLDARTAMFALDNMVYTVRLQ